MMHLEIMSVMALALGVMAPACAGTKRSATSYRDDTQQVLETRNAQVKSCYEAALKTDPRIGGLVTVQFTVEKETGVFTNATIDPTKSDAAEPLVTCILSAIKGLALAPVDANDGRATFVYELRPTAPPT